MCQIQVKLNGSGPDEVVTLSNIMSSYNVRVNQAQELPTENEMGAEFLPVIILLLPEISQFVTAVLPALKVFAKMHKQSGTKHDIELVNGKKKIHVIYEDGKEINVDEIMRLCDQIKFFE